MADLEDLFGSDSDQEQVPVNPSSSSNADTKRQSRRIQDSSDDDSDNDGAIKEEKEKEKEKPPQFSSSSSGSDDDDDASTRRRKELSMDKPAGTGGDRSDSDDDGERRDAGKRERGDGDEDADDQDLFGDDGSEDERDAEYVTFKPERERALSGAEGTEIGLFFARLPNFLTVDPKPFDPETCNDEFEEDAEEAGDDDEEEARIRLKVENRIRWRYTKDEEGNIVGKESNARLIRWSDNSFSLLLGEELFEVSVNQMEEAHQYLVVQHKEEGFLQTQARFNRMMTFRPHSTNSITHKKLTMAIANKHRKFGRTKLFATTVDPEKLIMDIEKSENEKLKARRRMEAKQRSAMARLGGGLSEAGLEEEFSDDDRYASRSRSDRNLDQYEDDFIDDDDEGDDDDEEREREQRIMRAKKASSSKKKHARSSSSEASSDEDDDSDSGRDRKKKKQKRSRDSSDEEGGGGKGGRREDPMDEDEDADEPDDDMVVKRNSGRRRAVMDSDDDDD
ncbi:Paf1 complex component [Quaeritorhiza haematococci]|nr:Paf1 complex component [Quaeritorhiza haematococci]